MEKKLKATSMNIDAIIGRKGVILKPVKPLESGEVRIDSVIWTCLNKEELTIEEGSVVKVVEVSGNRLYVEKVEEKEGE